MSKNSQESLSWQPPTKQITKYSITIQEDIHDIQRYIVSQNKDDRCEMMGTQAVLGKWWWSHKWLYKSEKNERTTAMRTAYIDLWPNIAIKINSALIGVLVQKIYFNIINKTSQAMGIDFIMICVFVLFKIRGTEKRMHFSANTWDIFQVWNLSFFLVSCLCVSLHFTKFMFLK